MEKELDSILQILEKASTTDNVKELNKIQEQLQNLVKSINIETSTETSLSKNNKISDHLEKLKDLINKLDSNKRLNNELFLEFKKFIENRKFK